MRVIKIEGRGYVIKINGRLERMFKEATGKSFLDVGRDAASLASLEMIAQGFWAICSSAGKIDQTIEDFELIETSEFLNAVPDVAAEVKEKFEGFSGESGPLARLTEMFLSVMAKAKTFTGALSGPSADEGSESPEGSTSTASSGT